MRMRQLLYLKTIAEQKSITKASHKLFISQQAISQAIHNLETDLDTTLLNRSVHGTELTDDGKYVLELANQILALNDTLDEYFSHTKQNKISGSLKITAIQTVIDYFLPKPQVEFIKKHPQAQLTIIPKNDGNIISSLLNKETDLGFIGSPYVKNKSLIEKPDELIFTPFLTYKYLISVSTKSPLAKCKTLSIKNALNYPIAILEDQIENSLENYMPYRVLSTFQKPKIILASSTNFYTNLVKENIAISVSTSIVHNNKIINENSIPGIVDIPIRENIGGEMCYIYHKDNQHDELINTFLNIFLQSL